MFFGEEHAELCLNSLFLFSFIYIWVSSVAHPGLLLVNFFFCGRKLMTKCSLNGIP
jgi:hypothetical protein